MKITFRLVLLAAAAVLGFWLWTIFFPGPEKLVLRKISSLATTATFSASDSNITRAAKAGNLVGYFTTDAQIIFDAPGQAARTLSGRDEIREAAYGGFASLPALKVQFLDVTVRIGTDKQTADVNCTARVTAGDSKDYGVQEMHFQLKKVDGSWLISRAETVKTLS
jgi:ketosteroid isomerase-like protein